VTPERDVQVICDCCEVRRKTVGPGYVKQVLRLGTTNYVQIHTERCPVVLADRGEKERNP
jgi:hypothetical protein